MLAALITSSSGSGPASGVPGSTFTIRVWSALVGRTNAVASAKILPSISALKRSVTSAWPFSATSASMTLPLLTPATPAAGSLVGLRP